MDTMDFSKFRDTAELSDIVVVVDDEEFKLHKFPLYIKSDFFKALARSPTESSHVALTGFPGGPELFALVADYCYNIKVDIGTENVVYLRCAAEFLQMTGKGNLTEVTDRYLHDVVTSAKLSRSLAGVVDLLSHCSKIGRISQNAKIVEKCMDAVVHVWMKPPTKFSTPRKVAESSNHDETNMEKLSKLPLDLFHQLIQMGKERCVWPRTLAMAILGYSGRYMFPEDNEKGCQATQDLNECGSSAEGEAGCSDAEKNGDATEKEASKQICDFDEKHLGNILDTLLLELPKDAPLADVTPARWSIRALLIADNQACKCRPILMKLATQTLHQFSNQDFADLSAKLICEITEEACKSDRCVPHVVCKVIDTYMLDLAKKGDLPLDVFQKLSESLPKEFRPSHDLLFQVLEALLQSHKDLPEDKKDELLDVVDFSRLSEETLRRAYDGELVPANYITPAALDLCSKLRIELDSARSKIKLQDEDIKKLKETKGSAGLASQHFAPEYNSTPRTNAKFTSFSSTKYRKDDANTNKSILTPRMTSSTSSTARDGTNESGTKLSARQFPSSSSFRSSRKAADYLRWASLRLMRKKPSHSEEHQDNNPSSNKTTPRIPSNDLHIDLSELTDFSSSGINTDDVTDVMTGLAENSPRFSKIYMRTISKQ